MSLAGALLRSLDNAVLEYGAFGYAYVETLSRSRPTVLISLQLDLVNFLILATQCTHFPFGCVYISFRLI
jgi:hypothetical protein